MDGFNNFFWDGEVIGLYLHRPDIKVAELARSTGKSQAEVYRILHANGVEPNRLKNNHTFVNELADKGWSVSDIARNTGYTERNVRYILAKQRFSE